MTIEYHEPPSEVSAETRDLHRALSSLAEELEAIDWYQQRIDAATDEELRALICHNRDEEIEHVAMLLEFLRRRIPRLDQQLRTYLFTSESLLKREKTEGGDTLRDSSAGLGIGSMRDAEQRPAGTANGKDGSK